jgi:hypothetical protein
VRRPTYLFQQLIMRKRLARAIRFPETVNLTGVVIPIASIFTEQ